MTFYVAAFPMAPFLGLICILLQQRTEASEYLQECRRPVPFRQTGIGIWKGVLIFQTALGAVTNVREYILIKKNPNTQ